MELFIFYKQLVNPDVVPGYVPADYLPEDLVEVRVITDPRHPAYRQSGLFAKRTISNNTIVTSYAGFIEVFSTSCNSRTYTMGFGTINDDYALDAEFVGNHGRFANDPRSIEGCTANMTAESRFNSRGEPFTALVARRQINEGEEILMAYGKAHSLSPTPWINARGEALLQYRSGGIIPFPNLTPLKGDQDEGADAFPGEKTAQTAGSSPQDFLLNEAVSVSSSASVDLTAAYHITWECTQCGAWNICASPLILKIEYCSHCSTPKLSGAKMVSVLSSPPITSEFLSAEGGISVPSDMDAIFPAERSVSHLHSDANSSSLHPLTTQTLQTPAGSSFSPNPKKRGRPPLDHSAASTHLSSSLVGNPLLGSSGNACISPNNHSPGYSSVHVDWPMNIPFLPWQIWDNVISMVALSKYSRFVPHEHVFIYNVNSHDEHLFIVYNDGPSDENLDPNEPDPSKEALMHRDEGRRMGTSKLGRLPKQRGRQSGKSTDGADLDCCVRYGWVRPSPSGRADTALPPRADVDAVKPSTNTLECRELLFSRNLLHAHPNMDGFTLLHTRRAPQVGGWPTPLEATRRLLLNLTRRQFSGKAFQPGELVGYMGGCIVSMSDARCRPGDSPLAIPMKYLIPRLWRLERGGQTRPPGPPDRGGSAAVEGEAADLLRRLSALCLVVTNDMMYCPCLALADPEDDEGGGGTTSRPRARLGSRTPPSSRRRTCF
ncbi:unnamed protein product [Phytomonas sp. Hart1]|nr:unnamed protein product [Phytomonas sp. Hart1]|eukprot:CCW69439.1 unnamed protein product [Phytomonas sp. isolate Hart1]